MTNAAHTTASFTHVTVLRDASVAALAPVAGATYVDCTLGGGGHSEALLEAADCRVIGIDRDPAALDAAGARLARFGDRFVPVRAAFGDLASVLDARGLPTVDGILADLGVSSHQIDTAERGFSFRFAGPLDMRMDPDAPISAADVVNRWDEVELANIIFQLGEERRSRRVARVIVEGRPWSDTLSLAEAVGRAVGRGDGRINPATRTFQALRMFVNDELGQLQTLLDTAIARLAPGARLAVISFHSLEDRLVKQTFSLRSGRTLPKDPYGNPIGDVLLDLLPPLTPHADDPNPRARSARLRVAVRLP